MWDVGVDFQQRPNKHAPREFCSPVARDDTSQPAVHDSGLVYGVLTVDAVDAVDAGFSCGGVVGGIGWLWCFVRNWSWAGLVLLWDPASPDDTLAQSLLLKTWTVTSIPIGPYSSVEWYDHFTPHVPPFHAALGPRHNRYTTSMASLCGSRNGSSVHGMRT